jgi:hypothetical protein
MPGIRPERLSDNLFQVNLWMLQPPNLTNVRPLLREAGYRLYAVERELPIPVSLREKMKKAGIAIRQNPQPDVVLVAEGSEFLLVECKSKMFGVKTDGDDGHIKQARSYMLQVPKVLKESLGGVLVSGSHLAYMCCHDSSQKQSLGLNALAAEMKKAGVEVVSKCVIRLSSSVKGVSIEPVCAGDALPRPLARLVGKRRRRLLVLPTDRSGNDPRPLYLIPWMPNTEPDKQDDYNIRVFKNRILAATVTKFGRSKVGDPVLVDVEETLRDITRGVYDLWRNKAARADMRGKVRELIITHLRKVSGIMFDDPTKSGAQIRVLVPDEKTQNAIIRELRQTVDDNWQPNERTLFDKPDDYWDSDEVTKDEWKQ